MKRFLLLLSVLLCLSLAACAKDEPQPDAPDAPPPAEPAQEPAAPAEPIRRDELGEFYHDTKFNCVDWRTPAGDEVSLSPAGWRQLRDELPMILKILGVEL